MKTPIFRDATSADVAALARLHVTTFNETHSPILMNGPTYEVRAYQWRQAFESADGSWFCVVIEDPNGELIGFAEGQPYSHREHPVGDGHHPRPQGVHVVDHRVLKGCTKSQAYAISRRRSIK